MSGGVRSRAGDESQLRGSTCENRAARGRSNYGRSRGEVSILSPSGRSTFVRALKNFSRGVKRPKVHISLDPIGFAKHCRLGFNRLATAPRLGLLAKMRAHWWAKVTRWKQAVAAERPRNIGGGASPRIMLHARHQRAPLGAKELRHAAPSPLTGLPFRCT